MVLFWFGFGGNDSLEREREKKDDMEERGDCWSSVLDLGQEHGTQCSRLRTVLSRTGGPGAGGLTGGGWST